MDANSIILESCLERSVKGQIDQKSTITGSVEIGDGTSVINSIIEGPASIANDCTIKNSTIGPYTCVGENTVLDAVTVKNTIVMEGCIMAGLGTVENSIIGRSCILKSSDKMVTAKMFFIGDDSIITF